MFPCSYRFSSAGFADVVVFALFVSTFVMVYEVAEMFFVSFVLDVKSGGQFGPCLDDSTFYFLR